MKRFRAVWLASVIGLVTALLAACSSSSHDAASTARSVGTGAATSTSVPPVVPHLRVVATTSVPIDRAPLQVGFGAVWSASTHGLVRLSMPAAQPTVVMPSPTDDIAISGCCVYALSGATNRLIEFDPRLMKITRQWTLQSGAHSLVAGNHQIYVAFNGPPVAVESVNLQGGATRHAVIPHASALAPDRAIAAAPGKLWVLDGSSIYRLNPATLATVSSTSADATNIWFGDGSLWAANGAHPRGGVERIDPASGRVLAHVDADALQVAFSPHAVWLSALAGLTAVDPVTAKVESILPVENVLSQDNAGIAVVGNQIWNDYIDIGKLQRIQVRQ
jgi:hypothetical protein